MSYKALCVLALAVVGCHPPEPEKVARQVVKVAFPEDGVTCYVASWSARAEIAISCLHEKAGP